MKTKIEIAEAFASHTKEAARREGTKSRVLIEEGSRSVLALKTSYQWPDLSVTGEGLTPEIEDRRWESLRDRIYEGRGT